MAGQTPRPTCPSPPSRQHHTAPPRTRVPGWGCGARGSSYNSAPSLLELLLSLGQQLGPRSGRTARPPNQTHNQETLAHWHPHQLKALPGLAGKDHIGCRPPRDIAPVSAPCLHPQRRPDTSEAEKPPASERRAIRRHRQGLHPCELIWNLKNPLLALASIAQWVVCRLVEQGVTSLIPSQHTGLVCRLGPW